MKQAAEVWKGVKRDAGRVKHGLQQGIWGTGYCVRESLNTWILAKQKVQASMCV